jgi:hydroxypyruvate isomerase
MTACAATVGGAALMKPLRAFAAPPSDKPFAKSKLKISAPIGFFPGETSEEKLDVVAAWGLPAYEWLGPGGDFASLRKKADSLGLVLSCTSGAGAIKPGQMVLPSDHDRLVEQFKQNVQMAHALNCRRLIGLSGNTRDDASFEEQTQNVIDCVKRLAPIAEQEDVILVLEMLNPLVDHKGYFLTRTDHGMQIVKAVGSPNVKLLFDIYHQQITEGNVIRNFTENIDYIGHFHVADNPGRKEPGTGELNYANIFAAIAKTNYDGFVALECGHSTKNYEDTLNATLKCLGLA